MQLTALAWYDGILSDVEPMTVLLSDQVKPE